MPPWCWWTSPSSTGAPAPVELLPQTRRHALLAQLLARAEHRVRGQQDRCRRRPGAAYRGGARGAAALRRTTPASSVAGIVPVSALRGDNVTHAAATPPGSTAPACSSCWSSLPTTQERTDGPLPLPVQYVARDGEGVGPPGAHAVGPHRARPGARRRRGAVASRRPHGARVHDGAARRQSVQSASAGESAGLVLDRQLDVSRGDWIAAPGSLSASRTLRGHARLARHRAGADRPPVLGAPRQPLGAGAHQRASSTGSTSTRCSPPTRTQLAVNEIGEVSVETAAAAAARAVREQPRRRRADRGRSGQPPHQRRAAGARRRARSLTLECSTCPPPQWSSSVPAPVRPTRSPCAARAAGAGRRRAARRADRPGAARVGPGRAMDPRRQARLPRLHRADRDQCA